MTGTLTVENGIKQQWSISSPDERIRADIVLDEKGRLFYKVIKDEFALLDWSPMGMITRVSDFTCGMSFVSAGMCDIDETYTLSTGKMASYRNHAREVTLRFKVKAHEIDITIRVYNDGVAYRYSIPRTGLVEVLSESTGFTLPEDELIYAWAQEFHTSYENTYDSHRLEDLKAEHYGMPMLFQVGVKGWVFITEAAVYGNYCAANLKGFSAGGRTLSLSLAPDQSKPVIGEKGVETPWRVILLGDDLNTIIRSSILENLNPPNELEDTSWIKPGRSSWPWFTDKSSCASLEANQKFVDFTAAMGWEYLLVDAGWRDKLPVEELVTYADAKGVGIWLWAHSRNFREEGVVREQLSLWAGWGIKGVKIDFFESDSQEMIESYDIIARVAAEYKLMVNYHGCTKPAGERRRWPHIMTREGILGSEYFGSDWSWSELHPMGPTAEHNCTVPFTRNVVGAMDYTPVHFLKGKRRTTYSHQIALSVIFESGVQHYPDSIEAYSESIAKEFLQAVPAVWDDTLLLEGYPGRYVTMARRKGEEWYIGGICAVSGRTATIALDFLDDGEYRATIYEDGSNWNTIKLLNASEIYKKEVPVSRGDVMEIQLKKNGGCAVQLTRTSRFA